MKITTETGCWIDGTHMSPLYFATRVIDLAHDYGFELDYGQFMTDVELLEKGELGDAEVEVMDAIDWTYDDALEYLNSQCREGLYFVVEDSNLWLVEEN